MLAAPVAGDRPAGGTRRWVSVDLTAPPAGAFPVGGRAVGAFLTAPLAGDFLAAPMVGA